MIINRIKPVLLSLIISVSVASVGNAQDAYEIVSKSEEKIRGITSAYTEVTLSVIRPKWDRKLSLKSWSKGDDLSLVVITYPAKEKGTAFLKKDKDAWNWIPSIERTIKLSPSMMMQSWMGSDFTNDDFVRESSLVRDYNHKLLGDSRINQSDCYKIELIPKPDAAVVWGKILLHIEKEELIQLRSEMFDEDGILVKTMTAMEIREMDGRMIATRMSLVPVDKKGYRTEMVIDAIEFDRPINDSFFTTQNMKTVR